MATHTITFDTTGNPTPATINLQPGDLVLFQAGDAHIVLCMDPETVFGEERYAIPAGTSLALSVLSGATGNFDYTTIVGDLSARCGTRGTTGGDGSGKVGGQ